MLATAKAWRPPGYKGPGARTIRLAEHLKVIIDELGIGCLKDLKRAKGAMTITPSRRKPQWKLSLCKQGRRKTPRFWPRCRSHFNIAMHLNSPAQTWITYRLNRVMRLRVRFVSWRMPTDSSFPPRHSTKRGRPRFTMEALYLAVIRGSVVGFFGIEIEDMAAPFADFVGGCNIKSNVSIRQRWADLSCAGAGEL
ncbi:hypothetical protein RLEG12_07725 (plasmid) [Rhizobium leguminosarum bv. trifolii CB782]|nr:hypothetical protein RLEG12_07725 [Rhizobium leguminosarum bv. trifolii CB782]